MSEQATFIRTKKAGQPHTSSDGLQRHCRPPGRMSRGPGGTGVKPPSLSEATREGPAFYSPVEPVAKKRIPPAIAPHIRGRLSPGNLAVLTLTMPALISPA